MYCLKYTLYLSSPVLVTGVGGGDPNSGITLPMLPGSTLRGALIGCYRQHYQTSSTEATFRQLFLDDGVYFLNAYPALKPADADATTVRMLPLPLSWRREKGEEEGPIYDFAIQPRNDPDKSWKEPDSAFVTITERGTSTESKGLIYKPARQVLIHNARLDRQRLTDAGSTVFRYDSLASGQRYCGAILAKEEKTLTDLLALLPADGRLTIGRSQSATYGQVIMQWPQAPDQAITQVSADWEYADQLQTDPPAHLVVTLLSDTLLRDPESGAYTASLKPLVGVEHIAAFVRTRLVGGFNRTWNLPLEQTPALQAGSVFVYAYDAGLAQQLQSWLVTGIGERRTEGFGRIALNWQRWPTIKLSSGNQSAPPKVVLSSASQELATDMTKRMLRTQLDQLLLAAINRLPIERNGLQNSQLARLRVVVRRRTNQPGLSALADFLKNLRKAGRDQLQRARINNRPLLVWLEKLANAPSLVWDELGAEQTKSPPIGAIQTIPDDTLAAEYAMRLIDGIAKQAVAVAKGEGEEEVIYG